jgi:hypothetical protein
MSLDEQIAKMTNPQEFTRLCNTVFTDIYGHAFQVIDGTRSDNGNDGYVDSENRMLAINCPIKPEQKTDAGYLGKIRSDLAKALELKRQGKYRIDAWTFITPRKLSDNVVSAMRALGAKAGIRTSHQESTFLANELYRRPHLLEGFPALNQINLSAKINQVLEVLRANRETQRSETVGEIKPPPDATDSAGDARFHQLVKGVPTQEAKAELKAMAYKTVDPILEINAILALFLWFDPAEDNRVELVEFANRGLKRAKQTGRTDAEAVLHAQKSSMLLWDFNTSYIETYFTGIANFLVPLSASPLDQLQQSTARLRTLEESWKAEAVSAMDLIKDSHDPETTAAVFLILGTSLGQLAHVCRTVSESEKADRYLANCKTLLMSAKDAFAAVGDELGATNASFNLANQIRWHGGNGEALELVKSTIPIAEKHGDVMLLQKAKWLKHTLETGDIPDYAAGERRTWTEAPSGNSSD